jgi:hypothetical protein
MKGITTNGNIVANDISAGDWTGSLNFNVKFDVSTMVVNVTNGEAIYDGNATNGNAKVEVTYPTSGYTIKYGTTNGTYDLDEMPTYTNLGTYEVYYQVVASNYTTKTRSLTITINEGLNGYTWDEVSNICKEGKAKEYFSVGDEAVINIGALPNADNTTSAQTATIVVGDMTDTSLTLLVTSYSTLAPTHEMKDLTVVGSKIIFSSILNNGGWASTIMRTWLNDEYLSALSNDLQNAITIHSSSYSETYDAIDVSYCDDKVWLLSPKEVFGGTATSAGDETSYENLVTFNAETQLAYFSNDDNKVRYSSDTDTCIWWLRSSYYNNKTDFTCVNSDSSIGNDATDSAYSVFPAFTIGYAKKDSFSDYTWSEVQAICKAGLASNYFSVGDERTIDIGELPNASNTTSAQTATIVVGDISSDGKTLTMLVTSYSTLAPTHVINIEAFNSDGWVATEIRTWLNDEYLSALPSDLKSVITAHSTSYAETYDASSASYCDDKIWLLSEMEVFGSTRYSSSGIASIETQLAYFANGNSKVRYSSGTNTCVWWLRSFANSISISGVNSDNPDIYNFVAINATGNARKYAVNSSNYVFPAFCIG